MRAITLCSFIFHQLQIVWHFSTSFNLFLGGRGKGHISCEPYLVLSWWFYWMQMFCIVIHCPKSMRVFRNMIRSVDENNSNLMIRNNPNFFPHHVAEGFMLPVVP